MLEEREITKDVKLCDELGKLNTEAVGWSRKPIIDCNLKDYHKFRKKRWNYWNINNDKYFFTAAVTHMDYSALIFVYLVDIENKVIMEKDKLIFLGKDVHIEDDVFENVHYQDKDMNIKFTYNKNLLKININWKDFYNNCTLKSEFFIDYYKDVETLNVVIPWNKDEFQFTSKQNCFLAKGYVKLGKEYYEFKKYNSFASMDFGRGIWPRNIMWNWATFSGKIDGKLFGINLGAKWTQGTGMCENAIYIDEKLIKVHEDVEFVYDEKDMMKPWLINTVNSEDIYMEFVPLFHRIYRKNMLLIKSNFNQIFGKFNGIININDEKYLIKDVLGCVEEQKAKW